MAFVSISPGASCPQKKRKEAKHGTGRTFTVTRASPMSVRLIMSEICPKWHAEVLEHVVATDTLVAGDSEEEEDDIEQDEEEETEDDGYSE